MAEVISAFLGRVIPASIASGAALSGEIDLRGFTQGSVIVPSAWTTAAITFLVSDVSGGTFVPCRDSTGSELSITNVVTNASNSYIIPSGIFNHRYIKVQSGVTGTTVNQTGVRSLKVILK